MGTHGVFLVRLMAEAGSKTLVGTEDYFMKLMKLNC